MGDTLVRGAEMARDQELVATEGNCKFVFQGDGNLVIYRLTSNGDWEVVWSPQIENKGGVKLVLQDDGNLVVYRADGHPIWANNRDGRAVEDLVMQNDENLVAYGYDRKPVWASNTYNAHPFNPGSCGELKKEVTRLQNGGPLHGTVGKPPPDRGVLIEHLRRLIAAKGC